MFCAQRSNDRRSRREGLLDGSEDSRGRHYSKQHRELDLGGRVNTVLPVARMRRGSLGAAGVPKKECPAGTGIPYRAVLVQLTPRTRGATWRLKRNLVGVTLQPVTALR